MGNQICKWLSSTESITLSNSERGTIKGKRDKSEERIMVRSSSTFSNTGRLSIPDSFWFRKMPLKTIQNSKNFYHFPDNSEFQEVAKYGKFKILSQDFNNIQQWLNEQLVDAKESLSDYADLLENRNERPKKSPYLLLEIVSGQDINVNKSRPFPFVEIVQNMQSNQKAVKESIGENTTMGTDQVDSYRMSVRNFEETDTTNLKKSQKSSKLVLSTPVPVAQTEEGIYEWSRFLKLPFDSSWIEKERSITVNLYKTKKNKEKCEQLGKPKSLFLINLRNQFVKDCVLEFKDGYESKCDGKVTLRLQYIFDEHQLFSEIFNSYQERVKLIEKWMSVLENQISNSNQKHKEDLDFFKLTEDDGLESQHAGFYSIWENESYLGNGEDSPTKFIDSGYWDKVSKSYKITSGCII